AGGRQSRARRPAGVHPVAHRSGGRPRTSSGRRSHPLHGARPLRRVASAGRTRAPDHARKGSQRRAAPPRGFGADQGRARPPAGVHHHRRRRDRLPRGSGPALVDRLARGGAGRVGPRGQRPARRSRRRAASSRVTSMLPPLRIIIADDHALFRQGLRSMFVNLHPEVTVVAEVESVGEVARTLAPTPCDVLLLDLQMERNALADIASFARRAQVIVVTASQDPAEALAAVRAGARAVVFKRFAVETLVEALRAVREGHVWLPPALQTELAARLTEPDTKTLTSREREIVRLVALGFQNSEIARRLEIGDATVKTHLNNVFHKLEVRDRVALTLYAIRMGLVGIHEKSH